jgi:transcription termination factor Rho
LSAAGRAGYSAGSLGFIEGAVFIGISPDIRKRFVMAGEALEQSMLDGKDKDQLLAIAQALGIKANARLSKATIIDKILESTGVAAASAGGSDGATTGESTGEPAAAAAAPAAEPDAPVEDDAPTAAPTADGGDDDSDGDGDDDDDGDDDSDGDASEGGDGEQEGEGSSRRRRRRRRKNRGDAANGDRVEPGRDRPEPTADASGQEPVEVAGYLDLRDEGYGFLRLSGYLASRDDSYVPVKLARQYGLRKGDHVTGLSRPPGRNEKNPAMLEVHTVNGVDPDEARNRPRFDDLTAVFPTERLVLDDPTDPANVAARAIDLLAPVGKGQRAIVSSAPKVGRSTVLTAIASAIEHNHPDVTLIVLLVDERPEDVTAVRNALQCEVVSSTFDRPSDEHTHLAEMVVERAKRLVESGDDVVLVLDGITRLGRAYNLSVQPSGRTLASGIDAYALLPLKRLFGAGRATAEAGSLTIVTTAQVESNSRIDEAIFDEVRSASSMEVRLDRLLAERRLYPAVDAAATSSQHEELLFTPAELGQVRALRRAMADASAQGGAHLGLELLLSRIAATPDNAALLAAIAPV